MILYLKTILVGSISYKESPKSSSTFIAGSNLILLYGGKRMLIKFKFLY